MVEVDADTERQKLSVITVQIQQKVQSNPNINFSIFNLNFNSIIELCYALKSSKQSEVRKKKTWKNSTKRIRLP